LEFLLLALNMRSLNGWNVTPDTTFGFNDATESAFFFNIFFKSSEACRTGRMRVSKGHLQSCSQCGMHTPRLGWVGQATY